MSDLQKALERIAASSPPDDWENYSTWDGYMGYDGATKAESVDGVDESNMGDVHSHGVAVGLWMAAKIARESLNLGTSSKERLRDAAVEALTALRQMAKEESESIRLKLGIDASLALHEALWP